MLTLKSYLRCDEYKFTIDHKQSGFMDKIPNKHFVNDFNKKIMIVIMIHARLTYDTTKYESNKNYYLQKNVILSIFQSNYNCLKT